MEAYDVVIIGAGTHPGGSISGLPRCNYARVFLHHEEPIAQKIKGKNSGVRIQESE
ncbi:MAG: hypothetical protein RMZ41_030090 [Nostoc sp. DedVER02]|uniref:hypothetical protein n=1 Tax=unclassified Nostoc TaxID=2593658 RepID=UPI002AD24B88|nr:MULTISPECIES: hypothetical protein [unclassified Nostoc]MDZ7989870.1 hypothetical protein [Nostoc sp. DedVER02]MDZ8112478.1 hypothetical protein [Nostoc sp. DedVER01b]